MWNGAALFLLLLLKYLKIYGSVLNKNVIRRLQTGLYYEKIQFES